MPALRYHLLILGGWLAVLVATGQADLVAQSPTPWNQLREPSAQEESADAPSPVGPVIYRAETQVFDRSPQDDFQSVIQAGSIEQAAGPFPISDLQSSDVQPIQPTTLVQPLEETGAKSERVQSSDILGDEDGGRLMFLEKTINAELESVKTDSQLDDVTRSTRLSVLATASEWVQKVTTYRRKLGKFQADIDGFKDALQSTQEHLAQLESASDLPPLDESRPTEELQREMQRVQSELESQKAELESLHQSQARYTQRITEVPKQKSEAKKRLKKILDRLAEMTPLEADTHDDAKLLQFAMQIGTTAEIDMLNVESNYLEVSSQLSPLRIDAANHRVKQLESQFEQLNVAAKVAREREVDMQIQHARQAALDAHPRLAQLAGRNEVLAQQRKDIAKRIAKGSEETLSVTARTQKVELELSGLQKKIDEGLTSANTVVLAESHRQLASPLESRVRLSELKTELQSVNLAVSQLQDERETLADPQAVIVEQLEMNPDNINQELRAMATEFIEARRVLLDDLLNDYRSYRRQIVETTVQRDKLITGIEGTRTLLNEHMLWVRSADSVSLLTVKKSWQGIGDCLAAERWNELFQRLAERTRQQPYEYLMFTLGFAFLYGVVRRLKG